LAGVQAARQRSAGRQPERCANGLCQPPEECATARVQCLVADRKPHCAGFQAGNLSAAQQDFATIKQDFKSLNTQQSQASQDSESVEGHSHHHLGGDESDSSFSSLFSQLGKELQSGDLSSAQQTFSTLEQDFSSNSQQSGQTASDQASTSSVSVNV
jgi:hypothetical protein